MHEETHIDLLCDPVVNESAVANVTFTWTGPNAATIVTGDGDYTITNQPNNSTLRIESLERTRDNGAEYTCTVTATLRPSVESYTSLQFNSSVTLSVNGNVKYLHCVSILLY